MFESSASRFSFGKLVSEARESACQLERYRPAVCPYQTESVKSSDEVCIARDETQGMSDPE